MLQLPSLSPRAKRGKRAHPLAPVLLLSVFTGFALGQAPPVGSIPRAADGKPDFTGYWDIPYVNNITFGKEDTVPYTDVGRKTFQNRDLKDDPTSNCWPGGIPRIMQSPYPAQFVQTHDFLAMLFEDMRTWRAIPLNGRPHHENMGPAFLGDSVGHWEGDTLIVETTNLKGTPWTWLDTAGHQHSDALRVVERFVRKADSIEYQYTLHDPVMFTEPYTLSLRVLKPVKKVPGLPEVLEYVCTENNKDVSHLVSTMPESPKR